MGRTIVSSIPGGHKGRVAPLLCALAVGIAQPQVGLAQASRGASLSPSQLISTAAAGIVFLLPGTLALNEGPPPCSPCPSSEVLSLDRWIIGPERSAWDLASMVGLLGLAAGTWADQARVDGASRRVASAVEATAWAVSIAEVVKALVARKRPVLYTPDAPRVAHVIDNQRSFPSGHAAAAFAAATTYWLNVPERPRGVRLALIAAATGIGVMRVTARRHFPSDVVGGAALGVGTALVVQEVRF